MSSFPERHPHLGRLFPQRSSRSPSPHPATASATPGGIRASFIIPSNDPTALPTGTPSQDGDANPAAPQQVDASHASGVESTVRGVNPQQLTSPANTDALQLARDALWKEAYVQLQGEALELVTAYETLIADQNALRAQNLLTPENVSTVVQNQKARMESRRWTYPWFGRTKEVRDTVDSILKVVDRSAGLISAGMTMAPVYVSLPWSFVAILIPFVMNDSKELDAALDGLKEVIGIMSSYSYAEKAFLTDDQAKADFEEIACKVYVAILEYQASAAVYFAKSTLKRLRLTFTGAISWNDALAKVRARNENAQNALRGLDAQVTRRGFESTANMMQKGLDLMEEILQSVSSRSSVSAEQSQRENILNWICADNVVQDHFNVEDKVGRDYLGSGSWLLEDQETFRPWVESSNGTLMLRGMVGSGKSSLTCMVINHLIATTNGRIAFAYFSSNVTNDDQEESKRRPRGRTRDFIRRILKQCAYDSNGNLAKSIRREYDRSNDHSAGGWSLTLNSAVKALENTLKDHSKECFTFIFDALDECPNLTELLDSLLEIHSASPNLKLFMSGRPEVEPPTELRPQYVQIDYQNSTDLESYVEHEVERRHRKNNWTAKQAGRLKAALTQYASGMFRWVELELDLFLPRSSYLAHRQMKSDIDKRLSNLENAQFEPLERLYNAYKEIWANALGNEDEVARRDVVKVAIKWALCALRPLRTSEFLMAASLREDGSSYDISEGLLLAYCSNLIIKDSSNRIRLSHISVQQFFEAKLVDEFGPKLQHQQAFTTCMATLSLRTDFGTWYSGKNSLEDYGFFHWPLHLRASSASTLSAAFRKRHYLNWRLKCFIQYLRLDAHKWPTKSQNYDDSEAHIPTECSLLLSLEDLLNMLDRNGFLLFAHSFLQSVVRLVNLHVTALNQFQVTAKQLGFILGTESFLKHLGSDFETQIEIREEFVIHDMYVGYFDRLEQLSLNLSEESKIKKPREKAEVDSTKTTKNMRPRIVIERDLPCRICDLERWIEGSQYGEVYDIGSSFEQLSAAGQAGCTLCALATLGLKKHVTDGRQKIPRSQVQVRILWDRSLDGSAGRDILRYSISDFGHSDLELFLTTEGNPSSKVREIFQGREFDIDLDFVKHWQLRCDEQHRCIGKTHAEGQLRPNALPTRLIDVGELDHQPNPKLIESASLPANTSHDFVYLSFNWGDVSAPRVMNMRTLAQMMSSISLTEIYKLHREAILVCHRLGYRYLFADALCIAQDDRNDWIVEGQNVGKYLASADLVFAASSRSMNDPLMPSREDSLVARFKAHIKGEEKHTFGIGLRLPLQPVEEILKQSILNRRWRIQEAILPRRILVFGKEQLHWICQENLASQSTTRTRSTPITSFPSIVKRMTNLRETKFEDAAMALAHHYWFYNAELSSGGELTFSSDALPAIAGIASNLQQATRGTYLSGLWKEDIVHGLLWIKMRPSMARPETNAPTWTWAADTAPISYVLVPGLEAFEKSTKMSTPTATVPILPSNSSMLRYILDLWLLHVFISMFSTLIEAFSWVLSRTTMQPIHDASGGADALPFRLEGYRMITHDGSDVPDSRRTGAYSVTYRTTSLQISAFVRHIASLESETLDKFEYFMDYELGQGRDASIEDLTLVAISPWTYSPQGDARWAGLILEKVDGDVGLPTYKRQGVFLGPSVENGLLGWDRSTLTLI